MKEMAKHNGQCLYCGKESKQPFCNRECYRAYVKSDDPTRKKREEKERTELSDRVVKRNIYIGSKGKIKYNQITPEMIIEKRAQILAWRERKTNPQPKQKPVKYCKICGVEIVRGVYCGDECRKKRERNRYYEKHEYNLERARVRDSVKVAPKHEVVCGECGKVFMQEYRNTRSTYCSDVCMRRSVHRNAKHKRRIRLNGAFVERVYKARIFKRDKGICQICGKKVASKQKAPHPYSATLDHIIPLSKGGTHEPKNIRLAHFICNSIKSDGVSDGGDQLLLFG
jgi:hypothetical protein